MTSVLFTNPADTLPQSYKRLGGAMTSKLGSCDKQSLK